VTVASTQNRKTFAGDDATTSFATTPIVFFATSDLQVYVTTDATGASTLLTEGVGYAVSGGDETSGAVGTVDTSGGSAPHGALLSGTTLVILRELPLTQGADFVNNDAADAEVAEAALDKLVMNVQRLDERIDRSFVLPDSDVSGASTELPTPTASTIIGWNSAADALQNYVAGDIAPDISVSTFMETVLDDVDAATARATLVAAGSGDVTASDLTMNTARLLGRTTASAGTVEEISVAASLTLSGGSLSGTPATTSQAGVAELATQAEMDAGTADRVPTTDLNKIAIDTPIATTSGTEHDFTVPAGTRRVVIDGQGVSTDGTSSITVRLGDATSVKTTGYTGLVGHATAAPTVALAATTTGCHVNQASSAARSYDFKLVLDLIDPATNTWSVNGTHSRDDNALIGWSKTKIALDSELTTVRLTTVSGDAFDAGSVNVQSER
jgi:hypothetical protein